ncbi:hypothetical protein L7F22_018104 [Adiantum nelumboides]|nr:hypothetical protein [Adiantum nelumboides]
MFGHYQGFGFEVFDVKALVNCHVMPAGIGAFPLILGRPWLQATKAIQDWGHGTITLYNRSGDKQKFDMATEQSLDANYDEDDDDEEYSSEEGGDGEESSELDDSDVEVIFPALDRRVKNIAQTYSLEHKEESNLFDQMLVLLNSAIKEELNPSQKLRRDLICCTEAIQTTLCKHMSKEEEQVFPLLMELLSYEEQSALVWQFICSIPVNLMENFLPWLASCLTDGEREEMIACVHNVVPSANLLQQIVCTWLKAASIGVRDTAGEVVNEDNDVTGIDSSLIPRTSDCRGGFDQESSALPNSDLVEGVIKVGSASNGISETSSKRHNFPIDVFLSWHKAIRKELVKFAEDLKRISSSAALHPLKLSERVQFLAEVCIFHSV